MTDQSIYDSLGVPRVINATGTKTRIGGSLIRTEAIEAMADAATSFVRLSDLQAAASERIADLTGAEAGYVTSGAESGMMLAAAAAIAGDNPGIMDRLPNTDDVADEIVVPRTHRTGYDHAFQAAGGTIIDVGTNDRHLGTGASNLERWELSEAIGEKTAAVGYVEKPYTDPPLEDVVEVAHENDVPVIVDAAAELPPIENFKQFVETGADLVAFSGGKAIRGPQTTGILAGRRDLIESVALQHLDMHAAGDVWSPPESLINLSEYDGVPRQGIGRSNKVGKEELVGLLVALDRFIDEDIDRLRSEWRETAEHIATELAAVDGLATSVTGSGKVSVSPEVVISVDDGSNQSVVQIVRSLREESPRVFVGADQLSEGAFSVNPMCLHDEEVEYVIKRIVAASTGRTVND